MKTKSSRYTPLLLLCAGCGPAIYTFHVAPNRICAGDHVTLDWNASKTGTISAVPQQAAPGDVPPTGATTVKPTSSVRYHLEVSNFWGSAARDNDVELLAGRSLPIGQSVADLSARCADRTLSVTALASTDAWSAHAVVAGVTTLAADRHRYHIEHAGVTIDLGPGEISQAFVGKPVAGAWALSFSLLDAETCGTPSVPRNLGIQLVAACSTGTP